MTNTNWPLILDTLEEGKCILLLGPEATQNEEGESLHQQLLADLTISENEYIAQYYAQDQFFLFPDAKARTHAYYQIKQFYKTQKAPERFKQLAQIPFSTIISVNPDLLFPQVLSELGLSFESNAYQKGQNPPEVAMPTKETPLVYNLFGSISSEASLVLTHDDMYDYLLSILGSRTLPLELANALTTADNFIFVGFDFDKWYVQLLLRLLNLHNKEAKFARYASNHQLSDGQKRFCQEQFNIDFTEHSMDKFITELYQKCQEAGMLKTISDGEQAKISLSQKIQQLVANDETMVAINELEAFFKEREEEELIQEITLLKANLNRTLRRHRSGLIKQEDFDIKLNQINVSVQEYAEEVKMLEEEEVI